MSLLLIALDIFTMICISKLCKKILKLPDILDPQIGSTKLEKCFLLRTRVLCQSKQGLKSFNLTHGFPFLVLQSKHTLTLQRFQGSQGETMGGSAYNKP